MNPKFVNSYHADTSDLKKKESGEYFPYDYGAETVKRPEKVGDIVILEIYPYFKNVINAFKYEQEDKYPPEYLVLAEVTRFTESGGFYCKILEA